MNYTYLHYQTALGLLSGVGPVRAREIINSVDSLEDIFQLSINTLVKKTGYPKKFFEKMDRSSALKKSVLAVDFHQKNEIESVFFSDPEFPESLLNCPDAPIQLFKKGAFHFENKKTVAIVGTRSATTYGQQICKELIESFRDEEIVVLSGLAYGIDAWVHHYCVENNVPTIGVLGHGLDRIYPNKHKSLARKMLTNGGLLTEFIPGTKPDRENFPKRNRIVAGLADATIVVESKDSGGSLITARLANDYNKDVFAFPGGVFSDTSAGCNELITNNQAHLIQGGDQFLEHMNWTSNNVIQEKQVKLFPKLNEIQNKIVAAIGDFKEIQIDLLSVKVNIPISSLNVELFSLEMNGVVRCLPGNKYIVNP